MILKQNKVVKLHLESFSSTYQVHFQLEHRNWNRKSTRSEHCRESKGGKFKSRNACFPQSA